MFSFIYMHAYLITSWLNMLINQTLRQTIVNKSISKTNWSDNISIVKWYLLTDHFYNWNHFYSLNITWEFSHDLLSMIFTQTIQIPGTLNWLLLTLLYLIFTPLVFCFFFSLNMSGYILCKYSTFCIYLISE